MGAGPVPIELEDGWLLFYHGVHHTCQGFNYSFGAAILDKNEPWKVLYRTGPYLLHPETLYEMTGDVPNVCFPCATLVDGNRIAIYYGAADTVVGLCFGYIDEIVKFTKENSIL